MYQQKAQENNVYASLFKQKCILGLGCKEKKKNWCAAGSKKVGKLTSPLGT